MLNFLIKNNFITYKSIHPTGYEDMVYRLNNNINIAKSYYLNMTSTIFAPNPLINLLYMLDINPLEEIDVTFYKLKSKAIYYANQVNIVTGVRKIEYILDSVIVPSSKEIFIYKPTTLLEPNIENIRKEKSISLLYTDKKEIEFLHPTDYYPFDNLFNIYTIDVVLLGLKYYLWAKERLILNLDINIEKFLYVEFINIIEDFVTYTIFNNLSTYMDIKDYSLKTEAPFSIIDVRGSLRKYYNFMHKEIKRKSAKSIYEFLYSYYIPTDYNVRFIDVFKIPSEVIITNHNLWALLMSKLDYLIFMFKHVNRRISNDIRNDIKLLLQINVLNKLPAYLDEEIKDIIVSKSDILLNLLKG